MVAWEVEEGTDEFAGWFGALTDDEQVSVGRVVELLVEHGPSLPFPYSSGIATSRHRHMRELRIQHGAGRTGCCIRLTRGEPRFSSWAATRLETIAGTTNTFRLPTGSTTSTSGNWNGKD